MSKLVGSLKEITRQMEMLDALFRHATEGIIVVGSDGRIVMANPKATELFGYGRKELQRANIEVLIPDRFGHKHIAHRRQYHLDAKARGMGSQMELYAKRKDGSEFPVEVSLSPFQTSEGQFVVAFIIDITHRKKQESAILEANLQIQKLNEDLEKRVKQRTAELAEAIQKIEISQLEVVKALEKERELNLMKSQFVTVASHEFRTPLATILSSTSLISKYTTTADNEKREKHIQRIKATVNNLTEILNDFLSIGKLEEGKVKCIPVLLDLKAFWEGLIEEMKELCKPGQTIRLKYDGKSEAWLDKQLLRNVLFNLLSNAIKYSGEGSQILVQTSCSEEQVKIDIHDQGIGISQVDQPYIFDRFFRASNAGAAQGTGLGLNIVKGYVELMDGAVSLTSTLGRGTTFHVSLVNKALAALPAEQVG